MEKDFLDVSYSLNLEKFGWRRVDLLISTRNGKTASIANSFYRKMKLFMLEKALENIQLTLERR